MEKRLANIDKADVLERKKNDEGLSTKELAVACGVCYKVARAWWLAPGFPAVDGVVVFWSDFVIWRRRRVGLESPKPASRRPRAGAADRSDEPQRTHG
jgi:hypothetical protein